MHRFTLLPAHAYTHAQAQTAKHLWYRWIAQQNHHEAVIEHDKSTGLFLGKETCKDKAGKRELKFGSGYKSLPPYNEII